MVCPRVAIPQHTMAAPWGIYGMVAHEQGFGLEMQGLDLEIWLSKEHIAPMDFLRNIGETAGN